jgi:hypothetical protein
MRVEAVMVEVVRLMAMMEVAGILGKTVQQVSFKTGSLE